MSDAPPLYWSASYVDAFVKALNEDPSFQRAARKFRHAIQVRCLGTPEGEDVAATYTIDRGRVTAERRAEATPSRALRSEPFDKAALFARTTAPYAIWCRLVKGEMNPVQAIASPDYTLEGPKLKVLANIGVFNAMNAVGAALPKRFA